MEVVYREMKSVRVPVVFRRDLTPLHKALIHWLKLRETAEDRLYLTAGPSLGKEAESRQFITRDNTDLGLI